MQTFGARRSWVAAVMYDTKPMPTECTQGKMCKNTTHIRLYTDENHMKWAGRGRWSQEVDVSYTWMSSRESSSWLSYTKSAATPWDQSRVANLRHCACRDSCPSQHTRALLLVTGHWSTGREDKEEEWFGEHKPHLVVWIEHHLCYDQQLAKCYTQCYRKSIVMEKQPTL